MKGFGKPTTAFSCISLAANLMSIYRTVKMLHVYAKCCPPRFVLFYPDGFQPPTMRDSSANFALKEKCRI